MNAKLNLMARQISRRERQQAPAPEVPSGIGASIEAVIAEEVERRVGEALAAQRQMLADQRPKPRFDDYRQIPPVPKTATRKPLEATFQRDGAGVFRSGVVNGQRFLVQRDAAGQMIGVVSEEQASEVRYEGQPVPPDKGV